MEGVCLACLRTVDYITEHHWPKTRCYGDVTVPLCPVCHAKAQEHDPETVDLLIQRAPGYWIGKGVWWQAERDYFLLLSRREYRQATGGTRG